MKQQNCAEGGKFSFGAEIFGVWSVEVKNSFKRKMMGVEMAYLCVFYRGAKKSPEISLISEAEMQNSFKRKMTIGKQKAPPQWEGLYLQENKFYRKII